MIKKYKKIGALLLGLSCLTGGFFTPVETYAGAYVSKQSHQSSRRVLVADMTTKELFNVVYGVLREKSSDMIFELAGANYIDSECYEPFYSVTFAMMPQSSDDYGLITIRFNQIIYHCDNPNESGVYTSRINHYVDFYIDKGSSRDRSVLRIEDHYGEYFTIERNVFARDYDKVIGRGFFYDGSKPRNNVPKESGLNSARVQIQTRKDEFFDAVAAKVKGERASAPSRSKER